MDRLVDVAVSAKGCKFTLVPLMNTQLKHKMLVPRIFEPKQDDILYHYCTASTLKAIVESGRIRFSDINMMNDFQESRMGYQLFEQAATEILYKRPKQPRFAEIDKNFFDKIDEFFSSLQLYLHPFIACLTLEGDQLSQWRSYADDGRGFAIGFRASALEKMPVTILSVEYNPRTQLEEMIIALISIYIGNQKES